MVTDSFESGLNIYTVSMPLTVAEVVALPVFPQLRPQEQSRVVEEIAAFYR